MTIGIVQVSLREETLAELFAHKAYEFDTIDDIICRLMEAVVEARQEELPDWPEVETSSDVSDRGSVTFTPVQDIPAAGPVATKLQARAVRPDIAVSPPEPKEIGSKYVLTFLGHQVNGENLWWPYAQLVDILDSIAPDVLAKLSEDKGRVRRYVSRDREIIHPGRPDLDIFQTRTGWWISRNIGRNDLLRGLSAMCRAGDLTFGEDVTFWSNKDGYISMEDSEEF